MTQFTKPPAVEAAAVEAVALGRLIAESWPNTAVDFTNALDPPLARTLARFGDGDVFAKPDEVPLSLMLAAIRDTLNGYSAGFGDFFMREWTGDEPLLDIDRERVRSLGETLKSFIRQRNLVINTVLAERQIDILRRR